ncbi:MAG TPA: hypothetical protein VFS05_06995 [Gemmatimonadaceae bacterium]|nr:hypothetical protein [Gemmatimonadaceae bacterium]
MTGLPVPPGPPGGTPARATPYELILEPIEQSAWPAIREEAEHRGVDTRRRDRFVLLGHVGATLQDMVPDDAPADAIEEYADLLYHGYQFWSYGRRLYVVDGERAEAFAAPEAELGSWILAAPPACYIQLPYQRFWARVTTEAPYEPVDGFFVVVDDTEPAPGAGAHMRILLILGLRADRPGISLVSYRTDLEPESAAERARRPWREDAEPFASTIPGGERRGIHTIATTSELEALVLRILAYLDRNPDRLIAHEPKGEEAGKSRLPYVEVL